MSATWVSITDHYRQHLKIDVNLDHVQDVTRQGWRCECGCGADILISLWIRDRQIVVTDPGEAAYVELVLQRIRFVP